MITPRTTRLLRVPDLQAMHRTLAECIRADASAPAAIIVPTAGAAEALGRTLAIIARQRGWSEPATPAFELLTRDDFYLRLHARLRSAAPMLTAFEREVLLTRAASAASDSGTPAPFRLRPGLIVEMLAFYDELRRRDRTVADFDRLMTDSLQPSVEIDRGAERLFRQTQFLTAAFTRFEDLVASSGRLDEHALRRLLLAHDGSASYPRVVVSVADQPADPRGLWTADFDFLARLPGLTVHRRRGDRECAGRGIPRARARCPAGDRGRTPGRRRIASGPRDAATLGRRRGNPLVRQPRPRGGARRARARHAG